MYDAHILFEINHFDEIRAHLYDNDFIAIKNIDSSSRVRNHINGAYTYFFIFLSANVQFRNKSGDIGILINKTKKNHIIPTTK
jgi:hypothetical protein